MQQEQVPPIRLAVVIPQYGQFEYTRACVASLHRNTAVRPVAIVVDDGSDKFDEVQHAVLQSSAPAGATILHRLPDNGGLTRAWNKGVGIALSPEWWGEHDLSRVEAICVTNNDVLFSPNWDVQLMKALGGGYSLVGPLSNAPGTEKAQTISHYMPAYEVSDSPLSLSQTAFHLVGLPQYNRVVSATINGFCMMGSVQAWQEHAYNRAANEFFRPRNEFNSKGERNLTPLMTLNEYELQRRWHKAGLKTGFCPGSFVFHYRAVTRGDKHKRGLWLRMLCRGE